MIARREAVKSSKKRPIEQDISVFIGFLLTALL
jgi:hypothetical protein